MSGCSSGERIEPHTEAPLHVRGRRLTEGRQAELKRIAAHGGVADGMRQRFHRHFRWREIGVLPRPHVDDVDPLLNEPALDRRNLGHRVGGQRCQPPAERGHDVASPMNLRSPATARYRPLPPFAALCRYRPLPPSTTPVSAPTPCRAKNSSQAPRTSAQWPTSRVAGATRRGSSRRTAWVTTRGSNSTTARRRPGCESGARIPA